MNIEQQKSGLLVATYGQPEPPPKPPEHPSRKVIREALAALDDSLDAFEQTTHGRIKFREPDIEDVTAELAKCYAEPSAFNISELSQAIHEFLKAEASGK